MFKGAGMSGAGNQDRRDPPFAKKGGKKKGKKKGKKPPYAGPLHDAMVQAAT